MGDVGGAMTTRWVLAILLAPATALAYSDPAMFGETIDEGGGAGRYFTGSRAEGYSCSVCHSGGKEPSFIVDPLPDVLQAGTKYSLVIHWPDPGSPQALQLELVTPSGAHPTVTIPAAAMLPAESRCEGASAGIPAVYSVDVGRRRIIGVEDCGASRVEISFIATGEPIDVAIGGVRSNEDGTPSGDGVFDDRFTLSQPRHASVGLCSTGGDAGGLVVPLLACAAVIRRRRSRKLDAEQRR